MSGWSLDVLEFGVIGLVVSRVVIGLVGIGGVIGLVVPRVVIGRVGIGVEIDLSESFRVKNFFTKFSRNECEEFGKGRPKLIEKNCKKIRYPNSILSSLPTVNNETVLTVEQ